MTLPHDVMSELRDGVVLCHLANFVRPRTVSQIHVKSNAVVCSVYAFPSVPIVIINDENCLLLLCQGVITSQLIFLF